MTIILPKSNLLEIIFPHISDYKNINKSDLEGINKFYSINGNQPEISTKKDSVVINIDDELIKTGESKFQETIKFNEAIKKCENGNFNEAMQIVEELLSSNFFKSEFHRVKGQILSESGSDDEAMNELIDALRLDPENTSALTMLGNVYSRKKDDLNTAINLYEKVLELNPEDHLAINNIAGNLAQAEQYNEAQRYFDLAYDLDPSYPNTSYGLALLASERQDYKTAFSRATETFSNIKKDRNTGLFEQNLNLAQKAAAKLIEETNPKYIIDGYTERLEKESGKSIEVISTNNISTPAKLEIAEVHDRDKHLVKFKSDHPAVEHLIMHELGHLELILKARENSSNKLFTSNQKCKKSFEDDNKSSIVKALEAQNIPKNKVDGFINNVFQGLNSQIYNTPIDLLIEEKLFNRHDSLRPFQFMSLLKLEQDYIASATDENIKKIVPKKIHRTNRILSLINTIQFKELYNLDLIKQFEPSQKELNKANELFKKGIEKLNNGEAGNEYKLIEDWAEDLNINSYFKLIDEKDSSSNENSNILDKIEQDPFSLDEEENIGKESFSNEGQYAGEMASTMYILDALKFFEDKNTDEIRKVGFEIGMLGRNGIDTNDSEKKYSLKSIPERKFSGMHLLAYMYTAFQEFEPDMDTGIDFDKEYEQALELFKKEN